MYTPDHFRVDDLPKIRARPFASLVADHGTAKGRLIFAIKR